MMIKSNKVKQGQERKGYKFRLIVPNSATEHKLAQIVGCCRFVWNKALALLKQDDEDYRTVVTKSKSNPTRVSKQYLVFKKRGIKDSFSFNWAIKHDVENGRIFIPKIGVWLRYHKSRDVLGVVKNITISKQSGEWYVSLQTERPLSQVNPEWFNANKIGSFEFSVGKPKSPTYPLLNKLRL